MEKPGTRINQNEPTTIFFLKSQKFEIFGFFRMTYALGLGVKPINKSAAPTSNLGGQYVAPKFSNDESAVVRNKVSFSSIFVTIISVRYLYYAT